MVSDPRNKVDDKTGVNIFEKNAKKKPEDKTRSHPITVPVGGSYKSDPKALNSAWSVLILWKIGSTQIQV